MNPPVVLTIAGTDSGGGAGIAADLATFASLGVHGACVVTAVTAQDTTAVHRIHLVPGDIVAAQLDAILADLPVAVVKTGLLGSVAAVETVAARVRGLRLVVDPVLRATSGAQFADAAVIDAYRRVLLPLATVATPNHAEAQQLGPLPIPVVRTGSETGRDLLLQPGHQPVELRHATVETSNDHGTGCTYSAALAAYLAHGADLSTAAQLAGDFTAGRLCDAANWRLGHGRGPIAHTFPTSVPTRGTNHDQPARPPQPHPRRGR